MEITYKYLAIVINIQYWIYLGNESNTITKFFDTEFAFSGTLYTYINNVLIYPSIILFCVFFYSFWVTYHESKVPAKSASTNL